MRALELIRSVVISIEFALVILAYAQYTTYPDVAIAIGLRLKPDSLLWAPLLGVPGLLLPWALSEAKTILAPATPTQNALLRTWRGYWRLKLRVLLGIGWIITSCCACIGTWMFAHDLTSAQIGTLILAAVLIGAVSAATLWLAVISAREIVEK